MTNSGVCGGKKILHIATSTLSKQCNMVGAAACCGDFYVYLLLTQVLGKMIEKKSIYFLEMH